MKFELIKQVEIIDRKYFLIRVDGSTKEVFVFNDETEQVVLDEAKRYLQLLKDNNGLDSIETTILSEEI